MKQREAPSQTELPAARPRASRGGARLRDVQVTLKVVTPIMGGSHKTRAIDEVDIIRVPTIRGHLRFWWRALYAPAFASPAELARREGELWGRPASAKEGGRSRVEVRVIRSDEMATGEMDERDIQLRDTSAYALWPARAERRSDTPAAKRRKPGTEFQLELKIAGTERDETEVRNALRAWILFGGYGGRTRRGLGSLTVAEGERADWLPGAPTHRAFNDLFGFELFAAPERAPGDTPWLGGATLYTPAGAHQGNAKQGNAEQAWEQALGWLREFRQGTSGREAERAREPGAGKPQPGRPSISNWPEADKVRHIENKRKSHPPRHNATPAWPRAGFGLPILGQFQTKARTGPNYDEPESFELRWRARGVEHERLASPLIVKALPLADGTFVACALWLNRAYPADAQVFLKDARRGSNSEAPFDRLLAPGDTARFAPLEKPTLREAFLSWLADTRTVTEIAP